MDDAGLADRVRFGPFELDVRSGELYKGPTRLKVPDQSIEILKALVERPGQLVTREELCHCLWPDNTFVDFEHGLNAAVRRLRDALGDAADTPRFIETLPRRGYRFVARVDPGTDNRIPPGSQSSSIHDVSRRLSLRRSAMAACALIVGAAIVWWTVRHSTNEPRTVGEIRSVAILPLKNVTKDATQDYFVEGMHEALITELARAGGLTVLAPGATVRYAGTDKAPEAIAHELNVQALVQGS